MSIHIELSRLREFGVSECVPFRVSLFVFAGTSYQLIPLSYPKRLGLSRVGDHQNQTSLGGSNACQVYSYLLYRALEVYAEDIVETSFDIEFDRIFNGFLATPDDTALLLGDGKSPWFEILGVKADAKREDVRNAFRALSLVHHPDRGGKDEDFKKINEAFREGMKVVKG